MRYTFFHGTGGDADDRQGNGACRDCTAGLPFRKKQMTVLAFLGTAAFGALCASLGALYSSERKIKIENVTQERKQWRSDVRGLSDSVSAAILEGEEQPLTHLRTKFTLILNPHDPEDAAIIDTIAVAPDESHAAIVTEFTHRIALLLKHDWERAKREASLLRTLVQKEPIRVQFSNFTPGDRHVYRIPRDLLVRFKIHLN
jgi:hypothetical protein